jgi:methyltransferase (TIGR00027 family)
MGPEWRLVLSPSSQSMTKPDSGNKIALTAFYCCALRAADAISEAPVCGDTFAARFVDDLVRSRMAPLMRFKAPAASNVARHRLIDDLLRDAIQDNPGRRIFIVGAGFDTRAFRLAGGRWWEFDDASLLALKEERLPARSAPNPVLRQPIDFRREPLAKYLEPLAGNDEAWVVLEGVSTYLQPNELTTFASTVHSFLPRARLVADLMSPAFRRRFSRGLRTELDHLGAHMAETRTHPRDAIEVAGYRASGFASIVGRAIEAGTLRIPGFILNLLLRELRDGYAVWTFEPVR